MSLPLVLYFDGASRGNPGPASFGVWSPSGLSRKEHIGTATNNVAEWRGFLAALDMELFDFARWSDIASFSPAQLDFFMARGQAMDEKFSKLAADIAQGAQAVTFNGQTGLMVNAPGVFHSLVGDLLSRQSGTFALMWNATQGGVIKVGLRSQRGFDCIPLAESMHGGGHAQACGFRMGVERLPALLSGTFNA